MVIGVQTRGSGTACSAHKEQKVGGLLGCGTTQTRRVEMLCS